jgi:hypothetical protein
MVAFLNLIPILLLLVPLVCTTIIARRMGRGRAVTALPLGLTAVLGLAWIAFVQISEGDLDDVALAIAQSVVFGGMVALLVSLIVLAIVGVKRDAMTPVEAR